MEAAMHEAPYGPLLLVRVAPVERAHTGKGRAAAFAAMVRALDTIVVADPALTLKTEDGIFAQLGGPDELSLERAADALRMRCAVEVGTPQVHCREAIGAAVEIDYTHKRPGLLVGVGLRVAPGDGGFAVDPILPGGLPAALLEGAVAGLAEAAQAGTLGGYPLVATVVTLLDLAWRDEDATPAACAAAACHALWTALGQAGHLLEPVMRVESIAPEAYEGALRDDFTSRGGVSGSERRSGQVEDEVAVTAVAALANLLGYASDLRGLTQGRGRFAMRFSHFRPLPRGGRGEPPPAMEAALRA